MANTAYQDKLTIVNTEMAGTVDRLANPTGYHPLVREEWGIEDRFRGLMGKYYTPVFTNSPTLASVAMISYSEVYNSPVTYAFVPLQGSDLTLGQQVLGGNEGTNLMFDMTVEPSPELGAAGKNTITLTFDDAGWKSPGYQLSWPAAETYFDTQPPRSSVPVTDSEIASRLTRLLGTNTDSLPYARLGASPSSVAQAIVDDEPVPGTPVRGTFFGSGQFIDYAFEMHAPSAHATIREKAEDRLSLESNYVQYIDSIPALEDVFANDAVTENLLPNVYYLQLELQNTGSTPLANGRYVDALQLKYNNNYNGSYVDWFRNLGQGQFTERNTKQFYEQYVKGLNNALIDDNIDALNQALAYTKNLFILHRDRDLLKAETINASTTPFYNEIRIPADNPVGYKPEVSILGDVVAEAEFDDNNLIDLLQYSAIENLESSNSAALSFTAVLKKINTAAGYSTPADVTYTLNEGTYTSVYNVNTKLDLFLGAGLPESPGLMSLPSPMGPSPVPPPLAMPQDNAPVGGQLAQAIEDDSLVGAQQASSLNNRPAAGIEVSPSTEACFDMLGNATEVNRTYSQIINGQFCHVETLMFVVKKYRVQDAGETLVQTFYLTNRFDGDDIVFYDSQVKTKQKYRYDIQKVVIVFGSKYSYDGNPRFLPTTSPRDVLQRTTYQGTVDCTVEPSYMQALLVPHVVGGIVTVLDDKPPIAPDMSFYSFRGVNNQLKILLQPTTGVRTEKPVRIEPTDTQLFLDEYLAQTGIDVDTIGGIPELEFRSDDPVDAYQVFKITKKPESYADFAGSLIEVNPRLGRAGALDELILPNTVYYYCARAVDINGNVSNPTHIFEIEMVDNAGQIFLRQEIFTFETAKPKFTTQGRRFIYIEPTLQQLALPDTQNVGQANIYNPPNSSILGAPNISKVWGETYKIRVRSTKTGRKLDLNVTFKNTGIVNPSE